MKWQNYLKKKIDTLLEKFNENLNENKHFIVVL